jgi:hypothetical protein
LSVLDVVCGIVVVVVIIVGTDNGGVSVGIVSIGDDKGWAVGWWWRCVCVFVVVRVCGFVVGGGSGHDGRREK